MLWKEGESKASIQRKTGVSQPTIRNVLKQAEEDIKKGALEPDSMSMDVDELEERILRLEKSVEELKPWRKPTNEGCGVDLQFHLNFTQHTPPSWYNDYWKHLQGGIGVWAYRPILLKLLSEECVDTIEDRLTEHNPLEGKTFKVCISEDLSDFQKVEVKLVSYA